MNNNSYYTQVAIIGAGVSGSALAFMLSRYTDIESISIFEKYDSPASLNSNPKANSQTLHLGDIESNYSLEKAIKVHKTSSMVKNYIKNFNYQEKIGFVLPKMLLAVGEDEIARLKQRYIEFKPHFPNIELWDEDSLRSIEPILLQDRTEPIMAMGSRGQITTIDYAKLSKSFIDNSQKEFGKSLSIRFGHDVLEITKKWDNYLIHTNRGDFMAKFVVVDAGAHSLLLAHKMGYGEDYAMLPIGGSFFFAKEKILNSKVYTMQHPKLPFAAVHGDPDLTAKFKTRFGPTAFATLKLERYHNMEISNLFNLLNIDKSVLSVYKGLMKDDDIRAYILRNFAHELPSYGRDFFIKEAQKIIPSLSVEDIEYADGYGGMRPQIIDKKTKSLLLGEAKINIEEGIIFNMTPSPGASSCLGNALSDVEIISKFLGVNILKDKIKKELLS